MTSPASGWYPAPDRQGALRYWDGRSWTDHYHDAAWRNDRGVSESSRLETAQWLMNHVEGQLSFGDTKSGLLLTADSILLAGLFAAATSEKIDLGSLHWPTVGLIVGGVLTLLTGLLAGLTAIQPNRMNLLPRAGNSKVNFAGIARVNVGEYTTNLEAATPADLLAEISATIHGKARWTRRKFILLYAAIALTEASCVLIALGVAVEMVIF